MLAGNARRSPGGEDTRRDADCATPCTSLMGLVLWHYTTVHLGCTGMSQTLLMGLVEVGDLGQPHGQQASLSRGPLATSRS